MGGISTSYHQPQQNAQQFSQTPTGEGLGLNAMANYLLNEKNQQITDLKEQLRELRDTNRIHEATIKDEREKRWKLEQDLQLKDREFNLEKLEIEATTSKGLNGILDRATSLIEQKPDILGYILPYFMGKGAAPLQIGGVPEQASPVAHMSTEAQQTYQELTQWLATVPEQALGEFFAIAMLAAQKKINLSQIISSTQNANL